MNNHDKVRHPHEIIQEARDERKKKKLYYKNEILLEWVTNHVLASVVLFDIALIIPLIALPLSNSVKITIGVISGSWIQWWALPALQRSQNRIQALNDAKAEVDHETLTYLAKTQDAQINKLNLIEENLKQLRK